jgi:hypothetical protein
MGSAFYVDYFIIRAFRAYNLIRMNYEILTDFVERNNSREFNASNYRY